MSHSDFANASATPRVIIIGAGLAGIAMAVAIKNQLGHDNFTIYERADAVGGTWRDNTYPGCGSDVPGHWYSLSSELNPNWSSYFAEQPELRAYWEGIWRKHGLGSHTVFNTSITLSEWDDQRKLWKCTGVNSKTGETVIHEAEILVNAIGGFMSPNFPKDVPGKDNFKGPVFHSARWRHDVDLQGKRVAVIGNGCSAAQFIPKISKDPSVELVNFCRTPQWYFPRGQYNYSSIVKWIFSYIPGVMRAYRNFVMFKSDISYVIFSKHHNIIASFVRQATAPKEYHESLIPKFSPGCKRIIVDPDYLSCLNRKNVSLEWSPIEGIVENGIKLKSGEVKEFDVIIFGTGFSLDATDIQTKGRNGLTINQWYVTQRGPTAYKGTLTPGYPNFFQILGKPLLFTSSALLTAPKGPNTATGHASIIFSNEVQISLATQLMKPLLEGKYKAIEVTEAACDEYNDWLQSRLNDSVWTECSSYYRAGMNGKNFSTFPGPLTLFWKVARNPVWKDFVTDKDIDSIVYRDNAETFKAIAQ
ncbi:hypothetical protein HWV62_15231 [Athelia sp. TMB]|nr:hypothetical protein HWV62_15231 [Athelia sp. TMB]